MATKLANQLQRINLASGGSLAADPDKLHHYFLRATIDQKATTSPKLKT
jgi:hypothetical protein